MGEKIEGEASVKPKFDKAKYDMDFRKKHYDRISLTVPKGRKDELKAIAKAAGESLGEYIYKAVCKRIEREEIDELLGVER